MRRTSLIKKKVCLLGSFAVGKTSLVKRFVYNRFDEKYLTTIGVKISQKRLPPLKDPKTAHPVQLDLLIWDIAGMDKFDSVVENYYRGAAGALAVADLTRHDSLTHLQEICQRFRSVTPTAQLLVLGNKLDIFETDKKTIKRLKDLASFFSTEYVLTSAKTGKQVEAAFQMLAKKMITINE